MEMLNEIKTGFIISMNVLWLFTGPRMLLTKERDYFTINHYDLAKMKTVKVKEVMIILFWCEFHNEIICCWSIFCNLCINYNGRRAKLCHGRGLRNLFFKRAAASVLVDT